VNTSGSRFAEPISKSRLASAGTDTPPISTVCIAFRRQVMVDESKRVLVI